MRLAELEISEQHFDTAESILREAYLQKPSWFIAYQLAYVMILQNKIDGEGQAQDYLAILARRGLADSYVRVLESQIRMQQGNWDGAIEEIKAAQAVFKSEPRMSAQLSLMLSECYNQTNSPELQLTALRNAVEGGVGSESSQFELAKALVTIGSTR